MRGEGATRLNVYYWAVRVRAHAGCSPVSRAKRAGSPLTRDRDRDRDRDCTDRRPSWWRWGYSLSSSRRTRTGCIGSAAFRRSTWRRCTAMPSRSSAHNVGPSTRARSSAPTTRWVRARAFGRGGSAGRRAGGHAGSHVLLQLCGTTRAGVCGAAAANSRCRCRCRCRCRWWCANRARRARRSSTSLARYHAAKCRRT